MITPEAKFAANLRRGDVVRYTSPGSVGYQRVPVQDVLVSPPLKKGDDGLVQVLVVAGGRIRRVGYVYDEAVELEGGK